MYTPPSVVSGSVAPQVAPQFAYGQDIARWCVLQPFSMNHQFQNGSILAMLDGNFDSFLDFNLEPVANACTTTLIFDFGQVLHVRGSILSAYVNIVGNAGHVSTVTYSFSLDGVTYTTIDTLSGTSPINAKNEKYKDLVQGEVDVRFYKIVIADSGNTGVSTHTKLFNWSVIV